MRRTMIAARRRRTHGAANLYHRVSYRGEGLPTDEQEDGFVEVDTMEPSK